MTIQSPPTLFGMVTTAKSNHYTDHALKSFFTTTVLNENDVFVLIDNDNVWIDTGWPRVNIIKNQTPKSFAENINQLIGIAEKYDLDLVVMNNDIICTPNWRQTLEKRDDIICLPSCNQTHIYSDDSNKPIFAYTTELTDYGNRWTLLYDLAIQHTKNNKGYFERLETPYYFFRLPRKIYKSVGQFDESFSYAGGEDIDYRIRAMQMGFKSLFTNESYILHFCGKSTWHGAENDASTQERNTQYFKRFVEKYGEDAANLLCKVGQPMNVIDEVIKKYNLLNTDDFASIVSKLLKYKIEKDRKSVVPIDQVAADGLLPFIENLGTDLIGCELGVCMGLTLRYFLDSSYSIKKVYAIDSWKPYQDHWGEVTQELVERWRHAAMEILEPHRDRIQILEMSSFHAASFIKNDHLDYIFIDGDHSYAAVSQDLRGFWPKVKKGGIFAGHDWQLETVKTAVEHFRQEYKITTPIQFTDKNVWFWYKEE